MVMKAQWEIHDCVRREPESLLLYSLRKSGPEIRCTLLFWSLIR